MFDISTFNPWYLALLVCTLVAVGSYFRKSNSGGRGLPYPPGPPAWPVIGNFFDMPTGATWFRYAEWARRYGDIVHVRVLSQHIVIISSMQAAVELLEKRSSIYSDRPVLPIIDMLGWDFNLGFIRYGERWRRIRRAMHQYFRAEATTEYYGIVRKSVQDGLKRMLDDPEDFASHVRLISASVIMAVTYGYEVSSRDDRFVEVAERSVSMISTASYPGASAVNVFPLLRYVPQWLPGIGFKRTAAECALLTEELQEAPLRWLKSRMAAGTASPSVGSKMLQDLNPEDERDREEEEQVVKPATGVAFAAGADTTTSSMMTAILAMTLYPATRKAAQAEIDAVVGPGRLPDFNDRERLPYVDAFMKEVMRWRPAIPLGAAHASTQDDVYDGYFLPEGTSVIVNVWAIMHDARLFDDPDTFKPERFMTHAGAALGDYPYIGFGFGRRVCVGRPLAEAQLWCFVACALAVFDFGADGDINPEYDTGMVSHPLPFKCRITIRDPQAESLLRESDA